MKSLRRRLVPVVLLVSLALLLGACGNETPMASPGDVGQAEIETDQPTATEPASPSPAGESPLSTEAPEARAGVQPVSPVPIEITPVEPAARTGEAPQDLLQAVIEDLLGRLDVSREAITVEEAGAVVWPDGSLGCPQPGMMYTQALVSGYQIILRVGEETFDYHASGRGYFVLCEVDMAEEPLLQPTTTGDSSLPIFVEMVVTPLTPDLYADAPPVDTSPSGVYLFNPGDRTLLVSPAVQMLPTTEVLVGLSSPTVPGRPYFASSLYQLPSEELMAIQVIAIDADTGTLTLAYAEQTFDLGPGQSKSIKQGGEVDPDFLKIATITNYGRLEAIELLSLDPSSP